MGVDIEVVYEGGLHTGAKHGPSGDTLTTDAPVDNGGKGEAFSPTDLVATALGACMVTVMGIVARRDGIDMDGTRVHVVKEMVQEPVRRIGTLRTMITFPAGRAYDTATKTKLENAANTCPVKQSLHPDVRVELEFVYP
jgi:putative redox protein